MSLKLYLSKWYASDPLLVNDETLPVYENGIANDPTQYLQATQVIANSGHDDMIVRTSREYPVLSNASHLVQSSSRQHLLAFIFSNHADPSSQHDAVLDYYGRKLATCSSDRTIKIFEIEGETQRLIETLKG